MPDFRIGQQAAALRGVRCATGAGLVGWVAVGQKPAVNADPAIDFGYRHRDLTPALRACLAIPLIASGTVFAVLALYRADAQAFADDHVRLLELLGARLCAPLSTALAAEAAASQPASLTLVRRASGV